MLPQAQQNTASHRVKRLLNHRELPRTGVLNAELEQSLQRDVSRCHENLDRYESKIAGLVLQNKLELDELKEKHTKRMTDLRNDLRQKGEGPMIKHLNEEELLLHKHLQMETQHSNELLQELRKFTLNSRGRTSLIDYYRQTAHVVLDHTEIQQLWEFWQHVLLEHKLCWDNLQLEFKFKVKGHKQEDITRWSCFKEEKKSQWRHIQREHEELWHSMDAAQETWKQKNQEPDSFLDFERQALGSFIETVQSSKLQTIREELQEMRDAVSGQNKPKMQMFMDELKDHWQSMQAERTFIEEILKKVWLPHNLEILKEKYVKEAKTSWQEKMKRVIGLYDNMQRVSRHQEYQSIREGLTTSQLVNSETAKCLESMKVAQRNQWHQNCTRSAEMTAKAIMAEETRKE